MADPGASDEGVLPLLDVAVQVDALPWTAALGSTEAEVEGVCRQAATAAVRAALADGVELPDAALEISIVLADDAMVRELNRAYRGQDKATNVLSFAAIDDADEPLPEDEPLMLGDVIIAFSTTRAEADAEGMPLGHHLQHLVVHGVLHLLGYDHIDDAEAVEMEGLESVVLAGLGVPDPYARGQAHDGPLKRS